MPSGFKSAGIDFDDLFDPDIKGDGPYASGLTSAGAGVKYAALVYGAKRPDVGIQSAGADVSNLWAAKGTASYESTVYPVFSSVSVASDGASGAQTASFTIRLKPNGECDLDTASTASGTTHIDSKWFNPLRETVGAEYQVMFEKSGSGGSVSNGAPAYIDIGISRAIRVSLTVSQQRIVNVSGSVTIRVKRISDGAVVITKVVTFDLEAGNSA